MMTILLLLGILLVAAFGILIFQAKHAPEGHEDTDGFHFVHATPLKPKTRQSRRAKPAPVVKTRHIAAT